MLCAHEIFLKRSKINKIDIFVKTFAVSYSVVDLKNQY